MRLLYLTTLCLVILNSPLAAQEPWSLERCVRESLEKSLVLKQYELNKQGYDITGKQLRMEHLPSLNASTNGGVSFGRVINPVTNNFETENSFYQSIGINSGLVVFNGFRLKNSIRQNDIYREAAGDDLHQAQNDIALNVALAYLNVLFAYENTEIARDRIDLSNQQLNNLNKFIDAGTKPENDRFDILAQIAADEQSLITAENNIENNLLSLKQQMWMEPNVPLNIERPTLNLETLPPLENETFDAIYTAALSTQPQIHASTLREEASEAGVDIAKAQLMPTLSFGADFGTNWSDLDREITSYSLVRIPTPGVFINGEEALFEVESEFPSFASIPYGRQLDKNIGYGIGAQLSIPIFNNYAAKANVEKAKINVINASIETDKTKQTLKTNIQNALSSAKAARKTLAAAEASLQASKIALDNASRKSELGSISNIEYLSARNRNDNAENNLLIAKYDYYFTVKVIEYYMGRGIQLN